MSYRWYDIVKYFGISGTTAAKRWYDNSCCKFYFGIKKNAMSRGTGKFNSFDGKFNEFDGCYAQCNIDTFMIHSTESICDNLVQ